MTIGSLLRAVLVKRLLVLQIIVAIFLVLSFLEYVSKYKERVKYFP